MRLPVRAYGFSVGIHVLAVMIVLGAGTLRSPTRTVVLDFSLASAPNARQKQARAEKKPALPTQERKTVTPVSHEEEAAPAPKESAAEEAAPIIEQQEAAKGKNASPGVAASSPGSAEEVKGRYLGAHFVFIRDKIFRNLTYPQIARRRGWEGRVTVAFTVCPDGTIEAIAIVESSGFAVLDRSAVEAVKRSCPLPKPPLRTALIMPIVYRLE